MTELAVYSIKLARLWQAFKAVVTTFASAIFNNALTVLTEFNGNIITLGQALCHKMIKRLKQASRQLTLELTQEYHHSPYC